MQTLWWFIDDAAGGMGRPGFNRCHWFDLTLEGGVLLTWIGERASRRGTFHDLGPYLDRYGPRVAPFFGLTPAQVKARLDRLLEPAALMAALERLELQTTVLQDLDQGPDGVVRYTVDPRPLGRELEALSQLGVEVIISLMSTPPDPELVDAGFVVHHLPVPDLTPPAHEQVYAFTDLLMGALDGGHKVVTHCLAGVGRTSTMYLASGLLLGRSWDELAARIKVCNPRYQFKGSQTAYVEQFARDVERGALPRWRPPGG